MDEQRQGDLLEPTYSSSVKIRGVVLKTCRKQWTIERGGREGQGYLCWWRDIMIMMMTIELDATKRREKRIKERANKKCKYEYTMDAIP